MHSAGQVRQAEGAKCNSNRNDGSHSARRHLRQFACDQADDAVIGPLDATVATHRHAAGCAKRNVCRTISTAPAGFYVGTGVGQSRYDMDFGNQVQAAYDNSVFTVTGASMGRTHDTAYRVFGGYQFSPYVAIEGGWQDLGSVNDNYGLRNTRGDTFSRSAEWSLSGFNATLVGMYPFARRFAVIGKVGAFFSDSSSARPRRAALALAPCSTGPTTTMFDSLGASAGRTN